MLQKLTRNEKVACSSHVTSLQNVWKTNRFPDIFRCYHNFLIELFLKSFYLLQICS